MNFWIFVVTPKAEGSESYTARQIYNLRMKDGFWGLGEATRNRKNIRAGDQVIFYIGGPERAFGGTARLASDSFELTAEEQSQLSHGTVFFTAKYGVRLDAVEAWEQSRPVAALVSSLKFVKNPEQWGVYLQGGIRQIEEIDYSAIVSGTAAAGPSHAVNEEIAAQNRFALEAHLEDFIERNWSKIAWGASLELYREGDQTGRQFPAGTWSIDFLAVDAKASELVVIELKRGQTSDATVGQVLRYMTWVRKNLAVKDQNVRGIIVASEIDEALRYAANGLPNVSVKTYSVTFSLKAEAL
jgi:hypothetical protein